MKDNDFMDDFYKSMDPFGSYDENDDGHYDDDERFQIEEDDRFEAELLKQPHNSQLYDDDLFEESDEDNDDDIYSSSDENYIDDDCIDNFSDDDYDDYDDF